MPFVHVFGDTLAQLRKLFRTDRPDSQPFVISGSGTLGWDQIASNLTEPGDEVLVLHTGYFADSFADCFEAYGAKPTQLKAPIGERPSLDEVEEGARGEVTVQDDHDHPRRHVDGRAGATSRPSRSWCTGVSPDTLVIVDGVCSVGSEDIRFDDWGLDVVMTASQKGIGCPAGLSILMASGRAMARFASRQGRPTSCGFASWKNWLPSTVHLPAHDQIWTISSHAKLRGEEAVVLRDAVAAARPRAQHVADGHPRAAARRAVRGAQSRTRLKIKAAVAAMGLRQLAPAPENQANGMTAMYMPGRARAPPGRAMLPGLMKKGGSRVQAGGLHKEIATKYTSGSGTWASASRTRETQEEH